jgi:hypothetical protein
MSRFALISRPILATALESFRETRGWILPAALALGAILLGIVGDSLPASFHESSTQAGAFCYGGLCLVMALVSMALGSQAMARDRRNGFMGLLRSKPLSGLAYFLGRFLGLCVRVTLLFAIPIVTGSLFLQLVGDDEGFAIAKEALSFRTGGMERDPEMPVLLRHGGPEATWHFSVKGTDAQARAGLRFSFRPRYLRDEPFEASLPIRVTATQGDSVRLEDTLTIRNRKSLELFFTLEWTEDLLVSLRVTGGRNALEIAPKGCRLIRDETGPLVALPLAALSGLPVLYLSLALALVLSSFLSIPTAFFASAVLALFVLYSPSLQADLRQVYLMDHDPSGPFPLPAEHEPEPAFAAQFAAKLLALLPDPRAGGGLGPLSRSEKPDSSDIAPPWQEAVLHLAALLLLGCCLAGRRET